MTAEALGSTSGPSAMTAVRLHALGSLDGIAADTVAAPRPGEGELLVRVEAAGVNPVDWKTAEGRVGQVRLPYVMGHDLAGAVVEAAGSAAAAFRPGDRVYANLGFAGGAFAEYAAVPAAKAALRPASLDAVSAAALPVAANTAWQALHEHGGLRPGARVLVHGGAGSVGGLAVQLAKLAGAHVVATAAGDGIAVARGFGADEVTDVRAERFEAAANGGFDLVFDTVGGDTQARSWGVLRRGGALVSIVAQPPAGRAQALGVRAAFFATRQDGRELAEVARLIDAGKLRVRVGRTLPLARAREALALVRDGGTGGKVVLTLGAAS